MNKKKNSKRGKGKVFSNSKLFDLLLSFFKKNPNRSFNYKQLCSAINIKDFGVKIQVVEVLQNMKDAGVLKEIQTGAYKIIAKKTAILLLHHLSQIQKI